jgi:hypothetical protein
MLFSYLVIVFLDLVISFVVAAAVLCTATPITVASSADSSIQTG